MIYKLIAIAIISITLSTVSSANTSKLQGRDAVVFAAVLNNLKMLKPDPGSNLNFFTQVFDGKSCSQDAFKSLNTRFRTNKVICHYSDTAIWDVECIIQDKANKTITEKGVNAVILTNLLKASNVTSKQERGGVTLTANSVDCTFVGHQTCKGSGATCEFP